MLNVIVVVRGPLEPDVLPDEKADHYRKMAEMLFATPITTKQVVVHAPIKTCETVAEVFRTIMSGPDIWELHELGAVLWEHFDYEAATERIKSLVVDATVLVVIAGEWMSRRLPRRLAPLLDIDPETLPTSIDIGSISEGGGTLMIRGRGWTSLAGF